MNNYMHVHLKDPFVFHQSTVYQENHNISISTYSICPMIWEKKILNAYATLNPWNLLLSCKQDHSNFDSGGTKNFKRCIYIPQIFCMYVLVFKSVWKAGTAVITLKHTQNTVRLNDEFYDGFGKDCTLLKFNVRSENKCTCLWLLQGLFH